MIFIEHRFQERLQTPFEIRLLASNISEVCIHASYNAEWTLACVVASQLQRPFVATKLCKVILLSSHIAHAQSVEDCVSILVWNKRVTTDLDELDKRLPVQLCACHVDRCDGVNVSCKRVGVSKL